MQSKHFRQFHLKTLYVVPVHSEYTGNIFGTQPRFHQDRARGA